MKEGKTPSEFCGKLGISCGVQSFSLNFTFVQKKWGHATFDFEKLNRFFLELGSIPQKVSLISISNLKKEVYEELFKGYELKIVIKNGLELLKQYLTGEKRKISLFTNHFLVIFTIY